MLLKSIKGKGTLMLVPVPQWHLLRRNNTQLNDTKHKDSRHTQYNYTQYNDIQHKDTQDIDIRHYEN